MPRRRPSGAATTAAARNTRSCNNGLGMGVLFLPFRLAGTRRLQGLLAYLVGVGVIVIPWMAYTQHSFGWILPHTIYAKTTAHVTIPFVVTNTLQLSRIVLVPMLPLCIVAVAAAWSAWNGARVAGRTLPLVPGARDFVLDLSLVALWGLAVGGYLVNGARSVSNQTLMFFGRIEMISPSRTYGGSTR